MEQGLLILIDVESRDEREEKEKKRRRREILEREESNIRKNTLWFQKLSLNNNKNKKSLFIDRYFNTTTKLKET